MTMRLQVGIGERRCCLALGPARVPLAQEQGTEPAARETVSDKDNPSSKTDVSAEANAVTRTSQGKQTGLQHSGRWSETGFLAGEAALNSLVAVEGLKYSLRREWPFQGDGSEQFFPSGGTLFPSEHAASAWSVAGVIAHEYPGPLTKIMAYGFAFLVDISRVRARQHFPLRNSGDSEG